MDSAYEYATYIGEMKVIDAGYINVGECHICYALVRWGKFPAHLSGHRVP